MSFIETGRAKPNREMVLRLADTPRLQPHDRYDLLSAAGDVGDTKPADPQGETKHFVSEITDRILTTLEPYPSFAFN